MPTGPRHCPSGAQSAVVLLTAVTARWQCRPAHQRPRLPRVRPRPSESSRAVCVVRPRSVPGLSAKCPRSPVLCWVFPPNNPRCMRSVPGHSHSVSCLPAQCPKSPAQCPGSPDSLYPGGLRSVRFFPGSVPASSAHCPGSSRVCPSPPSVPGCPASCPRTLEPCPGYYRRVSQCCPRTLPGLHTSVPGSTERCPGVSGPEHVVVHKGPQGDGCSSRPPSALIEVGEMRENA